MDSLEAKILQFEQSLSQTDHRSDLVPQSQAPSNGVLNPTSTQTPGPPLVLTPLPEESPNSLDSGGGVDAAPITDGMLMHNSTPPLPHELPHSSKSLSFGFALSLKAFTASPGGPPPDGRSPPFSDPRASTNRTSGSTNNGITASQPGSALTEEPGSDTILLRQYLNPTSFEYLPQRYVADLLLEKYFSRIYTIMPIVLETEVRREYDRQWGSDKHFSREVRAQLYAILAIGYQFLRQDDEISLPHQQDNIGHLCYSLARGFVLSHALSHVSIGTLQVTLLTLSYEQGMICATQSWLTFGLAVRAALGLGLHAKERQPQKMPAAEHELRNRLWWHCFLTDR